MHVSNTNELIFLSRKEKQNRETGEIQVKGRNKTPKEIRKKKKQMPAAKERIRNEIKQQSNPSLDRKISGSQS